jgi:hypothetical protein
MSDVPSRMLRKTLRDGLKPPSRESTSGCLDADVLAAWADGTLSRHDRARVESHAASCARCQAMLAAMATTAPPVPTRKWWQTSTVRWLVPLATVSVVAVVVWVKTPSERLEVPAPQLIVETNAVPAPASEPEARAADVTAPKSKVAAPTPTTPQGAARPAESSATVASAPPPAPVEQPAAPPVAATPPPPAPARAAAPPVQSSFRTVIDSASAENVVIVPPTPVANRQSARSEVRSSIQSPNQDVRWRIVAGTVVERSTDGGISWQTQSTEGRVRLVAGVAPSATVCWLVGSGGVVLRSIDGRTWQRAAFPEMIDLTAIVATDASSATVTAADGRVFITVDGGQTWRTQ